MRETQAAAKTRDRLQRCVEGALRPRLFRCVHVRSGWTARRNILAGDIGAPNPIVLASSENSNRFFVILSQKDLLFFEIAFSSPARQPQQCSRFLEQFETIRAVVQNNFAGEGLPLFFERLRRL